MKCSLLLVALACFASVPAWAGPAHVLASRAFVPAPAAAAYAISPALDPATQKVLAKSLNAAGLRVTSSDEPHAYLVDVRDAVGALCSSSCSQQVLHDNASLDDYYRHEVVVAAQVNAGDSFASAAPIAWFTVLQSDGLSSRRADYLPTLLRYGERAYGRNATPERPPRLSPPVTILPLDFLSRPGA